MSQLQELVYVLEQIYEAKKAERTRDADVDDRDWLWPDEIASEYLRTAEVCVKRAITALVDPSARDRSEKA